MNQSRKGKEGRESMLTEKREIRNILRNDETALAICKPAKAASRWVPALLYEGKLMTDYAVAVHKNDICGGKA